MKTIAHLVAATASTLLLSTLLIAPAQASKAPALTECVTLSNAHSAARGTNHGQLLLKDGDAHYRVDFGGSCNALARNSTIQLEANGKRNQICPTGTEVRARRDSCKARSVETIEQAEYDRKARRNR